MKKFLAILMAAAILMTALAGCANSDKRAEPAQNADASSQTSSSAENGEKIKIGVMFRDGIDLVAAKALFDVMSAQYNVEFFYSEVLKDIEAELAFVDNAASYGCKGIISWALNNIPQVASACADHEIYYVVHTQWNSTFDGTNPYFVGTCGFANPPKGEMYKQMLSDFLSDREAKGILITSGQASSANLQQIETTTATLEAIAEYYDLTFSGGTIDELAVLAAGTKLENDKNVNVYLLPGTIQNDGYTTQLSMLLCTGEYDVVAAYDVNTTLVNTATEAEEVTNNDIIIGGIVVISDAMVSIFNSRDQFGNCPVNRCAIQYSSVTQAAMFSMCYNAICGYDSVYKDENGLATGYGCAQVTVEDPGNGAIYGKLDDGTNPKSLVATTEWIDTLIADKNPGFSKDNWIEHFVNVDCNALAEEAIARISE